MSLPEVALAVGGVIGGVGGLGSLAAVFRTRAQNALDQSSADSADAARELTMVKAARELVDGIRAEMTLLRQDTDTKVDELRREVAYLKGALDAAKAERDTLRRVEEALRAENADLRARIATAERRVSQLTDELTRAAQAAVAAPSPTVVADRRSADRGSVTTTTTTEG